MFNKKRIVVFGVFFLSMFLFITFAGGTPQNQAIATRLVTFIDGYNNEELDAQTIIVGEDASLPNSPTHDGRVFVGWYRNGDRELRLEDADFTNITENIRAVALYGADLNGNGVVDDEDTRYTVTFIDTYDGSVISTQEVLVGMDAQAPVLPTHENMTFVGWSTSYRNIRRDTTVNTTWTVSGGTTATTPGSNGEENNENNETNTPTINTYTVTFIDGFDNSVITTTEVQEGLTVATPVAPTHDGYVFIGWNGNLDNITENTTVTATYGVDRNGNGEVDTLEETFVINYESLIEGTKNDAPKYDNAFLINETYTVLESTFELDNAVFIGWTTNEDDAKEIVTTKAQENNIDLVKPNTEATVTENVTYYAVWGIANNKDGENDNTPDYDKTYTVTFVYDNKITTTTVNYGESVTEPLDAQKEGYTLTWDRSLENITSDTTITAMYKRILTVTYTGLKNETGTEKADVRHEVIEGTKDPETFTPSNYYLNNTIYIFVGWQDENGNLIDTEDLPEVTENITYTAMYKRILTVTYTGLKNGTGTEKADVRHEVIEGTKDPETFTPSNYYLNNTTYIFVGWQDENGNLIDTEDLPEVTENITYTAMYKRILTVTYTGLKNETGTEKADVRHEVIEGTKDPETFTPSNYYLNNTTYIFVGWQDENGNLIDTEDLPEVTENITYTAMYKRILTVTYTGLKNETGTEKADVRHEVIEGTKDTDYEIPNDIITETNTYEFKGWIDNQGNEFAKDEDLPEVTENITYTAKYQKLSTVTYIGLNGKIDEITKNVEVDENNNEYNHFEYINVEENIEGFTFNGWSKPLPGSYIQNTTIFAKYKQNIIDLSIEQNNWKFNTTVSENDLKNTINVTPIYKTAEYNYLDKEELSYTISGFSNTEGVHTAYINHRTLGNYPITYIVYNENLYGRLENSTLKYNNPGKYIITSDYKYTWSKCVSDTYECNKEHKLDGVKNQEINNPFLELYVHKLDDKIVNSILEGKATITYNDGTKEQKDVNNMNYGYYELHTLKDSAWYDIRFMIEVEPLKEIKYVEIPYIHEGKAHILTFVNENDSLNLLK